MTLSRFILGAWTVEPALNQLHRDGREVALEPKVMRVLVCLAERGEVVTRADLVAEVWDGLNVVDSAVNRAIYQLRKALGSDEAGKPYVETVRQVGYRLTAPVRYAKLAAPLRTLAREPFRVRDLALVFMAAVLVGGVQLRMIAPNAPMFAAIEAPAIVVAFVEPAPRETVAAERQQRRVERVAERQAGQSQLAEGRRASRDALRQPRVEERTRVLAYANPGARVVAGEGVELIRYMPAHPAHSPMPDFPDGRAAPPAPASPEAAPAPSAEPAAEAPPPTSAA